MKHFIYAALIGAMGFASCANDDVVSNNQTTTGALKINAGIALHKVTRAFDNQWNKGDEIGVYLLNAGTFLAQEQPQLMVTLTINIKVILKLKQLKKATLLL